MMTFHNLCKLYVIWITAGVLMDIIIALTTEYGVVVDWDVIFMTHCSSVLNVEIFGALQLWNLY